MKLSLSIFSLLLMLQSCHLGSYSKGVASDADQLFQVKKQLMLNLGFNGVVMGKKYCGSCGVGEYTIFVGLKDRIDSLNVNERHFYNYYSIDSDTTITLAVTKAIYTHAKINDSFEKKPKDENVTISNVSYKLLNSDHNAWLAR